VSSIQIGSIPASQALAQSFLRPNHQLEGMSVNTDIASFKLQMRTGAGINLTDNIMAADISRTIDGASTFTVQIQDDNARTIQLSGKLGRQVDVEIDGMFFTLVGVRKDGRSLTLTFEEREINVLRYYAKYVQRSRNNITRAQFVLLLLKEVTEIQLRYVIPEIAIQQAVSDVGPYDVLVTGTGTPLVKTTYTTTNGQRDPGLAVPSSGNLTVKGEKMVVEQIQVADAVLKAGIALNARRKVLVSSIMVGITESTLRNLSGGPGDSKGVFQQKPSWGWPGSGDVATDATAYFQHAIAYDAKHPTTSLDDLCRGAQEVLGSDIHYDNEDEANAIVNAFGVGGGDNATAQNNAGGKNSVAPNQSIIDNLKKEMKKAGMSDSDIAKAVQQLTQQQQQQSTADVSTDYYFTRGQLTQDSSGQSILHPENSWQCITRLASEVNFHAFCVSGAIYYVSDAWLMASAPVMSVSEDSEGIDWIDYDYDEGKMIATVTITAHLERWSAPPGSVVQIKDMGIPDGLWLVSQVDRSMFDSIATITVKKAQPILPEPVGGSSSAQGTTGAIGAVAQGPVDSTAGGVISKFQIPMGGTPKEIIDKYVIPIAIAHGMTQGINAEAVTEANARHGPTVDGNRSDHQGPPNFAWADDMSNGTSPTPQMDALAQNLADVFSIPWTGSGSSSSYIGGYRFQMLYRTLIGGNHYNHVHFGVRVTS
jgi:hypothetical protein